MIEWFTGLSHVVQALLATIFTWSVTALGAGVVFIFKRMNKTALDAMLGFAGGVMIAASFWSLLSPSIEMAASLGLNAWVCAAIGFMGGGIFLFCGDKLFERMSARSAGLDLHKRSAMLVLSITLHNIPEGLAVGVAFGSLNYGLDGATLSAACMLALGIGLQNFPEGTAVSVPLRREGMSRLKAFTIGQLSGIVEVAARAADPHRDIDREVPVDVVALVYRGASAVGDRAGGGVAVSDRDPAKAGGVLVNLESPLTAVYAGGKRYRRSGVRRIDIALLEVVECARLERHDDGRGGRAVEGLRGESVAGEVDWANWVLDVDLADRRVAEVDRLSSAASDAHI